MRELSVALDMVQTSLTYFKAHVRSRKKEGPYYLESVGVFEVTLCLLRGEVE